MRFYTQYSRAETSSTRSRRRTAKEPKYEVGIVLKCHSDNQVRTSPQAETKPRLQLNKKPHMPRGQVESKGKITIPMSQFGRGPWDGMLFRETLRISGIDRTEQFSLDVGIKLHSLGPLAQHSLYSVKSKKLI